MNKSVTENQIAVEEPLYTFAVAVEMIPMSSKNALYQWLHRNRDRVQPVYQRVRWYEVGFLTASQIQMIRDSVFHSKEESRYARSGRPRRSKSIIDAIIARAMTA